MGFIPKIDVPLTDDDCDIAESVVIFSTDKEDLVEVGAIPPPS
jgi:hypothetical protein